MIFKNFPHICIAYFRRLYWRNYGTHIFKNLSEIETLDRLLSDKRLTLNYAEAADVNFPKWTHNTIGNYIIRGKFSSLQNISALFSNAKPQLLSIL